jgi:hypothetical protein
MRNPPNGSGLGKFVGYGILGFLALVFIGSLLPEQPSTPSTKSQSRPDASLVGTDVEQRARLLGAVVASAGETCDEVTRSFHQGTSPGGDTTWNVACRDGHEFAVLIKNDSTGSTRVLSCDVMRAVGKVDCFEKFR